jgi:hypothetical protein
VPVVVCPQTVRMRRRMMRRRMRRREIRTETPV